MWASIACPGNGLSSCPLVPQGFELKVFGDFSLQEHLGAETILTASTSESTQSTRAQGKHEAHGFSGAFGSAARGSHKAYPAAPEGLC